MADILKQIKVGSTTYNIEPYTSYLPTAGGSVTGELKLYAASGDSPRLTFQRGDLTDSYNDWSIYDSSGTLYLQQRGGGSTAWETRGAIDQYGVNFVGTISENGTSLASKYLGKTAKAADADKLDGNDSTYYLNYNNLTYKPTLGTAASKNIGTSSGNIPILDSNGKLAKSVIPAVAITDTYVVDTEAAMLALSAQKGDIAIRSDLNKSFVLQVTPASTLANWKELLTPTDVVLSVNGKTGAVTLNLDNINDGSTRKLADYVKKSLTSAKGDIIYASAANTPARLGIGSAGQFLSIANGIPTWVNNPNTDTKNTAGSTNNTNKLFLVGALSQAANPQTYSNSKVYMTDGTLTASSIMTDGIKWPNSGLSLSATSSDGSTREVASFEATSSEGTSAVLYGHLAVFGDDDSGNPYKPADKIGSSDLDAYYFNTGIALYDYDDDTTYKLSFPAKSGTFATLDDTKIEMVDLTTIA